MEKCKYCDEQLEEGTTVCPGCGKDNAPQVTEETPVALETEVTETAAEETTVEEAAAEETAVEEAREEAPGQAAENTGNEPTDEKPGMKVTPGKLALVIGALVVLLAVLIALVLQGVDRIAWEQMKASMEPETTATVPTQETIPPTTLPAGNPDDATCKGSYTAADEDVLANRDVVVATAGDLELTLGQLQIYYWQEVGAFMSQYGSYALYFGLDPTQPMDTQLCTAMDGYTWQHFFLACAVNSWHSYVSMNEVALDNDYEMAPEHLASVASLAADIEAEAVSYGFANAAELLAYNMSAVADLEEYVQFMEVYYRAIDYYNDFSASATATEEEVEALFAEKEADYAANGLTKETKTVNVRHILICPVASDGTTVTDEDKAAAQAKAQDILDQWLAGDATEESFAALAGEHTEDPGSKDSDGLYTEVYEGDMVPTFDAWCFDPERKVGDYGIVETDYGFHIMYYSGEDFPWYALVEQDVINEKINAFADAAMDAYPLSVDYSKILIAQAGRYA